MALKLHFTNLSLGYVVEYEKVGVGRCESWLLLPAENLWSKGLRGFLYALAMCYLFLGIAIISDIFMASIECITSKKRKIIRWDDEKQERVEKEIMLWNETVANLTLMALGSSAPEIMLAVIETVTTLGQDSNEDSLGTFTIIGSAAFNLLIITAVCIISVPTDKPKRIKELGVFGLTSAASIFAYLWMLVVLVGSSPGVIEWWEALLTFFYFPVLVLIAYAIDNGFCCRRANSSRVGDSATNVRVVDNSKSRKNSVMYGMSMELQALEKDKALRQSRTSLKSLEEEGQGTLKYHGNRRQTLGGLLGGRRGKTTATSPRTEDLVGGACATAEDLLGKFTFASPDYSVVESAGNMDVDVLFHRRKLDSNSMRILNGYVPNGNDPTDKTAFVNDASDDVHKGIVSVAYETKEGSAKSGKDFSFTKGILTFGAAEYRKTITIPIINDNQYLPDTEFYVILKSPTGDSAVAEPNVARIMIIDDDEPGEFHFVEPQIYARARTGTISATVTREKGCDGIVTLEYTTIDGTGRGGSQIGHDTDYVSATGTLEFKHGECSKKVTIPINKSIEGSKNFIITLRNPSLGAKIGKHSATVANIVQNADDIGERAAELIRDDEEEETWESQFRSAMSIEEGYDDDGRVVALRWYDYILHFVTFFWKVLFATVPPRKYGGAWPAFGISLFWIAVLTMFVEQIGTLLGCVVGLKPAVSGITIIALGTSLPDTFASRTAALHDEGADAAVGNVTGSNSVNVFLGLGLPWVISTLYHVSKGTEFKVPTSNLVSSVVIFAICGTTCILLLVLRRVAVGGELGGKLKIPSGVFLIALWLIYIILSSVEAYHPEALPW